MRTAFELAFAAGWKLTGALPRFLAMDDVTFLAPVETGALLSFEARCTYAEGSPSRTYSVSVEAKMSVPDRQSAALHHGAAPAPALGAAPAATPAPPAASPTANVPLAGQGQAQLTNTFNFIFTCDDAYAVPRVYPRLYSDAMAWVEANRRIKLGEELAAQLAAAGEGEASCGVDDNGDGEIAKGRSRFPVSGERS